MKKLLVKSVIFALILSSTVAYVNSRRKRVPNLDIEYMAAILDKESQLAQQEGDRLILVGGSNLAFGINSEQIKKETGKNVINLGLQASLGLEFMVNQAINIAKKGDIFLLSIEYTLYDDTYDPDVDLISYTQEIFPGARNYYNLNLIDKINIEFKQFRKLFQNQIPLYDSIYNRRAFNKYGDVIQHLDKRPATDLGKKEVLTKMTIDARANILKKIYLKCNSVGAKVYLLFPNYPASEFKKNAVAIHDLEIELRSKASFIKILNKPETFVFDDSLFFDTIYHLTGEGREKRTRLLINILQDLVSNSKKK